MPVYEYRCTRCGLPFDEFKKMADYKEPAVHKCGGLGERKISKPMISVDYPAYESPVSGRIISGKKEHEAELARTGCRLLEPGESRDFEKRQLDKEVQFDKMLDNALGEVLTQTKLTSGELNA